MGNDLKIDLNLTSLPPRTSVGRVGGTHQQNDSEQLRKALGDPPPPRADLKVYPEAFRKPFRYGGILQKLRRKLNSLSGENYILVPAEGERVCINEQGEVFVGMIFVERNLAQEDVLAGVLAHEWGHCPNRRKYGLLDHLSWDEIYRLRRHEETQADMFCGRALFMLGYHYAGLIQYLRIHDDPQNKSLKYHTVESRTQVISKTYESQKERTKIAGRIKMADSVYGDPIHGSRLIGS